MRLAEEGFEIGYGAVENHGGQREIVDPLSGLGSFKFNCANQEYGIFHLGDFTPELVYVGLHFLLEDTDHRNGLFGWMTSGGPAGHIRVENRKLVLKIGSLDIAVGKRIILPETLFHVQLELFFSKTIGSAIVKINDLIFNDISFHPDHSGNTNPTPQTYISRLWIGSYYAGGQGLGWIDDVIINSSWYLSSTDFSWPGRLTIRTSAAAAIGSYNEWSSGGLTPKWQKPLWPVTELPAPTPESAFFSTGEDVVIDNIGDISCPLVLAVQGPITNPKFENKTTSEVIEFTGEVPAGYYLSLQMPVGHSYLVLDADNSYVDWNGHINDGSVFWQLAAGQNTIQVSPAGSTGGAGWIPYYRGDWQALTFDAHPDPVPNASLDAISHVFKCELVAPRPPSYFAKIIPGIKQSSTLYWGKQWLPQMEHIYPGWQIMGLPHRMRQNPISGGGWDLAEIDPIECLFNYSNNPIQELVLPPAPEPPPPPTLSLTSPNGGQNWALGSVHAITWSSTDLADTIKIELARNGVDWETLFASVTNTGSKDWTISGALSANQALIRVSSVSDPTLNDVSIGPFSIVAAPAIANYYVATTGNDNNPGTLADPFRTITRGLSALASGDTLSIRGGTYAEYINNNVPSGSSWQNATTINAYGSETVILKPAGQHHVCFLSSKFYIIFDGLIFDGADQTPRGDNWYILYDTFKMTYPTALGPAGAAHHIRAINCTMRNAAGQGVLNTANCHHCEIINCSIHDNGGNDHDHGMYWGGADALIDGNEVYQNYGQGIQIFNSNPNVYTWPPSRIVIRNNYIHHNAWKAGNGITGQNLGRGTGLIISSHGIGIQAYNNIIAHNNGGIRVDWYAQGTMVYHNTVYKNDVAGSGVTLAGIYVGSQASGTIVRNNISYQNVGNFTDLGSGTVQDHNIFAADPKFVDGPGGDFHLQVTSPAIGAGQTVAGIPNTDYDDVTRGDPPDIGALEYV